MRKFGLLAAAAGLAIGGSVVRADFVISDTITPSSITIGSKVFDTVNLFVTNNGLHSTGTQTNNIDLAVYDSTGGGKNGMLISAGTSVTAGYPDIFSQFAETSLPTTSWIKGTGWGSGTGIFQPSTTLGGSAIANIVGGKFAVDQADSSTLHFHNTYADNQEVAGLSGIEFWSNSAFAPTVSSATMFAQVTVEHGDTITVVQPVAAGRVAPVPFDNTGTTPTTWDTGGTAFGIANSQTIVPATNEPVVIATPEPASIGFLGLAAGGLLARRRRQA